MKQPKILTDVEHQAARQLNMMVRAVKKQVQRLVTPGKKKRAHTAERQYLRAVEDTVAGAEKIIAKLKPRIAAAKRSLGSTGEKAKKKAMKKASRAPRTTLKKRSAAARKKKQ